MTRMGLAARLVAGAVIAVGAGAAVTGGVAFAWMPHTAVPVSQKVAPVAADSVLTCAGPLMAIGRDATDASAITVAADSASTVTGDGMNADTLRVPAVGDDAGPQRLVTSATGRKSPEAAGASSSSITSDDLGGFAASSCAPALMDSWIVAGETTTGAADLITLANPGDVAATVDLTVYGKDGPTQPAAGGNIIVSPGTETVLPLAGLGIGDDAPVVRVTATGAPVRATLQSSVTRGLATGGVDQTGVVASAAKRQVITGVRVLQEQQDDPTTIVRLLAPDADATAQVTVIGEHGTTGPGQEVPLSAGTPAELQLPLAVGDYSIVVTADQPVLGSVWQATGTDAGDDFAWATPAPELLTGKTGTLVSVPAGPSPELAMLPAGEKDVKVVATPVGGGDALTTTAVASQATTLALGENTSYRITVSGKVHAAVTFADEGALASYPVPRPPAASAPVTVYR